MSISSGDFIGSGRYKVLSFVAKGGMSAVYLGEDIQLGRKVALKAVTSGLSADQLELALQEARALARFAHPNVIRVFDVISEGQTVFLITEWVEGINLANLESPLDPLSAMAILLQILDGLHSIHSEGVIHRDLKPSNVMISNSGRVLLIDFGLARVGEKNQSSTVAGTLKYLDPRLLEGRAATKESDFFAAALLAYELCKKDPLVPDLAPLPLYRFFKKDFRNRIQTELAGIYPPLRQFIQNGLREASDLSLVDDLGTCIEYLREEIALISSDSVERIVAIACTRDAGSKQCPKLSQRVRLALEATQTSLKEKAAWLDFASNSNIETTTKTSLRKNPIFSSRRVAFSFGFILSLVFSVFLAWELQTNPDTRDTSEARVETSASADIRKESQQSNRATSKPVQKEVKFTKVDIEDPAIVEAIPSSKISVKQSEPVQKVSVNLSISANTWADVMIDGKMVGRIPRAKPFVVKPGKHRVSLINPYMETFQKQILIPVTSNFQIRAQLAPKNAKGG